MNNEKKYSGPLKVVYPEQMARLDRITISEYGIEGIVLMENAAICVVNEALKMLETRSEYSSEKTICIIAGKGNNGGDAFAAARLLNDKGFVVKVFLIGKKDDVKGDAAVNLNKLEKIDIDLIVLDGSELDPDSTGVAVQIPESIANTKDPISVFTAVLNTSSLVIDGLFGTGFRGVAKGMAAYVIAKVNESGKPVLSIDVPSGLDASTGRLPEDGECIRATRTITFELPKVGLLIYPGCEMAGELIIVDIGIPADAIAGINPGVFLITPSWVSSLLPKRQMDSNKANHGRILIFTGSPGMTGAGTLSARAAFRSGAGLVYLAAPQALTGIYNITVPEAITYGMNYAAENKHAATEGYAGSGYTAGSECAAGFYCATDSLTHDLNRIIEQKNVIAAGPGMSVSPTTYKIVEWLISNSTVPLVLDADALNIIAKDVNVLRKVHSSLPIIITPHPGEMARLTGLTISEVQKDRIGAAKTFAAKWQVIVILKGARTLVALPNGEVYINATGNPGMATAGTGDVLTGMVTSLIGQGMSPKMAAVAGVFLHGAAGDEAAIHIGPVGIMAGDIIEFIPRVLEKAVSVKNGNIFLI